MSQTENNNFIHNIRMGVRMIEGGMDPDLASSALKVAGINAPAAMLAAAAIPGVMGSMGSKPYTHARTDEQIAAHAAMQETLATIQHQTEAVTDDEGIDFKIEVVFESCTEFEI